MGLIAKWTLILGGAFVVLVVVNTAIVLRDIRGGSPTIAAAEAKWRSEHPEAPPPAPVYDVELLSSRGYNEYGFHVVTGEVFNPSLMPLEHVEVIVSWYTSSGEFVKHASSLIEFDPLLTGQTSPYKVATTSNPAMTNFRIAIKTMFGKALRVKDRSGQSHRRRSNQ